MRTYTVRDWVTVGLFGALWAVVEVTLGSYLHVIFPSQANTFLTGVMLGAIGVTVALTGRHFVPNQGSVLLIGVVTALLKLLSPGGALLGPFVAIIVESALMEAVLWIARAPRRWAFAAGGALAVGWNLPHKFIMMRLMYGKGIVEVATKMVRDGSQMLGLDASAAVWIVMILLLVRLAAGAIGGWVAWKLGGAVARRLRRRTPAASELHR
jgi:hypothetical protein